MARKPKTTAVAATLAFPGAPGATAPNPFGAPPGMPTASAPSPGFNPVPAAAPNPFGAPPAPAAAPNPFGAPTSVQNGTPAPNPFGAVAPPAPSLPAMAGQVDQAHVLGIMQQGGAGVTGDPAVASAITAILGTLKEIEKRLTQFETQHVSALNEAGKRIAELSALVKGASQQSQAAAPPQAPPPPPPAPTQAAPAQAGSAEHVLQITSQAVAQHMAQSPGQNFDANNPAVWTALCTIASQQGIQIDGQQMFTLWQQAGKINAHGHLVP